jgi:hypothetical protein
MKGSPAVPGGLLRSKPAWSNAPGRSITPVFLFFPRAEPASSRAAATFAALMSWPECRMTERILTMLWTLAIVLVFLWLLGLLTSYTLGGVIHILLVVALVVIVIRLFQGRRITA